MKRRYFLRASVEAGLALGAAPHVSSGAVAPDKPATRALGPSSFEVTTLGLGGQASLQWTPAGENPEQIILKALSLGVTYLDTSNVYGPSQLNFGKAFRAAHLIPGTRDYDEKKRRS